ncbi:hypothetical protein ALI144C_49390 [Actinosynnema sp. ALI-1.44]|uniref:HAD family hydrolase n=1 Tax=Actinosynnema sp. ALI-1.44 TaxID=1933779 RepID=UPI00097C8790|nr:HAD family hydrolase [Actinosynnema sp. ALI-1.44]ONI70640.1 hypothetical protein ALI144C_49390 [Actinosynnema sp. ALI-1.44]
MGQITTVLLDVGGILLLPTTSVWRAAVAHAGIELTDEQLRRAHYAATAAMDASGGVDLDLYRRVVAQRCGVTDEFTQRVLAELDEHFTGEAWLQRAPHAAEGIERLLSDGYRVGIVSNSVGTVAEMLVTAGVCQAGAGDLVPVEVVIDSGVVGVRKPDPAIFGFALEHMGVTATETAYLGDTARADVDGARLAGLRPIHFDPYGDCPDQPDDHEHLQRFDRLSELLAG